MVPFRVLAFVLLGAFLWSCGGGSTALNDEGGKDLAPQNTADSVADVPEEDVPEEDVPADLPVVDVQPAVDAQTEVDTQSTFDTQPEVSGTTVMRVDDLAEQLRSEQDLPGVAMMAFSDQGIVALGVAGLRKYGGTEVITDDDKFHLGSCTKAMTATLVARLAEQGILSFDSTMSELFPEFEIHADLQSVTIAQLLRHEGGVYANIISQAPDLWSSLWDAGVENITSTRSSFAETVLGIAPPHPIGTYNYSNSGYMIVGAAIEARMGASWEEVIGAELFEPLAMDGCGFGAAGTPDTEDQPWGHQKKNGITQPFSPGPGSDNPPALGPAGTVHCPMDSWAKFLMANLGGGPQGFLNADSWTQLHTSNPASQYALGWLMPGPTTLTHFGSNTLNVAGTWLFQHQDMGYAIATNMGPSNLVMGPMDESFQALIQAVDSSE